MLFFHFLLGNGLAYALQFADVLEGVELSNIFGVDVANAESRESILRQLGIVAHVCE